MDCTLYVRGLTQHLMLGDYVRETFISLSFYAVNGVKGQKTLQNKK